MKLSRAFCCRRERSRLRIVSLAWPSDCCVAFLTLVTSKTYQPNCVLTGPESLPFLAAKTALSSDFSCWPLATSGSLPPCDFEAESIEYFLATDLKLCPSSSARFACSAFAFVLVNTTSRSRRSGWANRVLFFSQYCL